mgnify:CR=1 FL=1
MGIYLQILNFAPATIYVGNLAFTASEDDVRQLFEPYGRVEMIDLTGVEALVDDENYYDLNHVTLEGTAAWADALKARWGPK